jgi:predicted DNA-binding transcriptional regulator AlpA
MKVLTYRDLASKGIPWSREHVRRMVAVGKFPAPFKLVERGWNVWNEDEIDAHLEQRASRRSTERNETQQSISAT